MQQQKPERKTETETETEFARELITSYFKTQPYPFTRHHIDSFDQFMTEDLPNIIQSSNPILILKDLIPGKSQYKYKVEIFVGFHFSGLIFATFVCLFFGSPFFVQFFLALSLCTDDNVVCFLLLY